MKQFISAHDVADIPALIKKALEYKSSPRKDEKKGEQLRQAAANDKLNKYANFL